MVKLAGKHRIQRVSPTEKRGRRHSSEVSVSVIEYQKHDKVQLDMNDVKVHLSRGSGPGGQHRNKTESCVTVTHTPTGITAKADGRSQFQNRGLALEILASRVDERAATERLSQAGGRRKANISLQHSYTWTTWRDEVTAPNGRRSSMKQALRGKLDPLLED